MMLNSAIKQAMDSAAPGDRWMHAYTYSAHPTCCAVALQNIEIIEREDLCANSEQMGKRLYASLMDAFSEHPNVGDIRGGKGLLAAVELVEDRASKRNFAGDRKIASRMQSEMMKRGVITRTRGSGGVHPAPGDAVYFAPPLLITEAEVDRLVSVAIESVDAALRV
jgi:adenosylmethionine-8-amino-7-oxononanoate aminotransferase